MRKSIKASVKGSFTVEASFIISLVIITLVCFLFLGFNLHDRLVASSSLMTKIYSKDLKLYDSLSKKDKSNIMEQARSSFTAAAIVTDRVELTYKTYTTKTIYSGKLINNTTFTPFLKPVSQFQCTIYGDSLCHRLNQRKSLMDKLNNDS